VPGGLISRENNLSLLLKTPRVFRKCSNDRLD
jgi:hypothetical protein